MDDIPSNKFLKLEEQGYSSSDKDKNQDQEA